MRRPPHSYCQGLCLLLASHSMRLPSWPRSRLLAGLRLFWLTHRPIFLSLFLQVMRDSPGVHPCFIIHLHTRGVARGKDGGGREMRRTILALATAVILATVVVIGPGVASGVQFTSGRVRTTKFYGTGPSGLHPLRALRQWAAAIRVFPPGTCMSRVAQGGYRGLPNHHFGGRGPCF